MMCFFVGLAMAMAMLSGGGPSAGGTQAGDLGSDTSKPLSEVELVIARLSDNPDTIVMQAALQALRDKYPGRIVLQSYGLSREGRTLHLLRILPWDTDLATHLTDQPAVAVVADLQTPASAESILRWALRLAEGEGERGQPEIVIYPLPDPDRWIREKKPGAGRKAVCLQSNFPIGWSPWLPDGRNAGSAPLSAPETRALAKSLQETRRFVGLITLPAKAQRVAAGPQDGSLALYAKQAVGLVCESPDTYSPVAWGRALASVESQRPKLRVRMQSVKRLSASLWVLDVDVTNDSQAGNHNCTPFIHWQVNGAINLASATAPEKHGPPFELLEGEARCALPTAGGSKRLRLVLQVEQGAAPILKVTSPKLGTTTLPIPLEI
ncbi:MAG: hypothetical protein GY930_22470 [bacterium]|nr:hypothetical protein [bacterium]